jgi:DNA polymerase I-like protein with 3'-5' exonuclease and polymerase domains
MGFFDDLEDLLTSPVRSVVRLSARAVATALGIPVALAQEAIDAGCETYADVRDYIREHR